MTEFATMVVSGSCRRWVPGCCRRWVPGCSCLRRLRVGRLNIGRVVVSCFVVVVVVGHGPEKVLGEPMVNSMGPYLLTAFRDMW